MNGELDRNNTKLEVFHDVDNTYDPLTLEVFCNEVPIGYIQKNDCEYDLENFCFDEFSKKKDLSLEFSKGQLILSNLPWALRIIEWIKSEKLLADALPLNIKDLLALEKLALPYMLQERQFENIPEEFKNLSNLRSIHLHFAGNPREFYLPHQLLTNNVKEISLSNIELNPDDLTNLTSLTSLHIHGLRDCLSENIGSLVKLRSLVVNGSYIDEIPSSVGELIMLEELSVRGAERHEDYDFTWVRTLPNSLANLENLKLLNLSGQNIWFKESILDESEVNVPKPLFELSNLEVLDISEIRNVIISDDFCKLKKLKAIHLPYFSSWDVEQDMFKVLFKLPNLKYIFTRNNKLDFMKMISDLDVCSYDIQFYSMRSILDNQERINGDANIIVVADFEDYPFNNYSYFDTLPRFKGLEKQLGLM